MKSKSKRSHTVSGKMCLAVPSLHEVNLLRIYLAGFLLLALLLPLVSCGPADPRTELAVNYQLWSEKHIKNYQYNLEVDCLGCADADKMPFTVVVRDGETSSITDSGGNILTITANPNAAVYDLDFDAPFTTIDKIFAYSQNVAAQDEDITGTYDPTFGFPTWMCYWQCQQRDPQAVDGDIDISLTNFKKLP